MEILHALALGVPTTAGLFLTSFTLGVLLALPMTGALRSPRRWLRMPVRLVVDLLRGVPVLVWLFLLYFGVSVGSFQFSRWGAAVVVLGTVASGYLAEVFRTATNGVDHGQWEAGRALGLGRATVAGRLIAPQAARIAAPSTATFALTLLKDSAIPSVIGVTDIAYRTTAVARETGSSLTAYSAAVVLYIALSVPVAVAARRLEARLSPGRRAR